MPARIPGRTRLARAIQSFRAARLARTRAVPAPAAARPLARAVAEQVFSRAAGAGAVTGAVQVLRDGAENYPAWLSAIEAAQRDVAFENYIIRDDDIGRRFADALCSRAQAGVRVRVLYDWLGCLTTSWAYWRRLRAAGVEVRCFNPPRLDSPLGWLSRNHRKSLCCDDEVGFVSGLCVGDSWVGDPARGVPPWRDTGIALRGAALAGLRDAFEQSWAFAGHEPPPAAMAEAGPADAPPPARIAGTVLLRVIASRPSTMGVYRLDQLIAGIARDTLWLTDAYFVSTTAYTQTLCDAARDGVDVRLLVPGASDIPVAKALSRAGYRPLLEAGVRVFEWNGPMLHAKTAVADGRWARIGSSNLNIASWMGNWELDVAVEDQGFARGMGRMYLQDLEGATEIVLDTAGVHSARPHPREGRRGSPGRIAAGAVGLGSAVGAAITNRRALGPAEAQVMAAAAVLLLAAAAIAVFLPWLLTAPLALAAGWVALTLLVKAWRLWTLKQPDVS